MSKVKEGDTVKVHYKGFFGDGTVYGSTKGQEPFELKIGEKITIPGFEKGIIGMAVGETKNIIIPAIDAYGEIKEDLISTVDKSMIPADIEPVLGTVLKATADTGGSINVTITKVTNTKVTLDGNHPFAGKEMRFELTLVSIN